MVTEDDIRLSDPERLSGLGLELLGCSCPDELGAAIALFRKTASVLPWSKIEPVLLKGKDPSLGWWIIHAIPEDYYRAACYLAIIK